MSGNSILPKVIDDATCPGCALLCDDLRLTIEGERLTNVESGCAHGRAWFAKANIAPNTPIRVGGQAADLNAAIARAAEILTEAHAPAIWGLAQATIETQRVAIALADHTGALVSIEGQDTSSLRAFQRVGEISASFGEVRDRADLIVYDAVENPHLPERFVERFAMPLPGRAIVWIGSEEAAREFGIEPNLVVTPLIGGQTSFYQGLRAIVREAVVDLTRVSDACGVEIETLTQFATRLKEARYGAFVRCGLGANEVLAEAKFKLVRDLNSFGRFVITHAGSKFSNGAGARAVLTWQSGSAGETDFGPGIPRYVPCDGLQSRLDAGEIDALLELAPSGQSPAQGRSIPRIVIRADIDPLPDTNAEVEIPTACPAIDEGGNMLRVDGVMLPLTPIFPGRRITQVEVLRLILARLQETTR